VILFWDREKSSSSPCNFCTAGLEICRNEGSQYLQRARCPANLPSDFHNDSARRPCELFANAVSASSSDQSCLGPGFVSEVRSIVAAGQVAFELCPVSARCTIWVSLKGRGFSRAAASEK